jgi:hypothetical protein
VFIVFEQLNLNFELLVFNATFSNISAISRRPVLVVEEAVVPGENHRPWASNKQTTAQSILRAINLAKNI